MDEEEGEGVEEAVEEAAEGEEVEEVVLEQLMTLLFG